MEKRDNHFRKINKLFTLLFLLLIASGFLANIPLAKDNTMKLFQKKISFSEFTRNINDTFPEKFFKKEVFVNMNGLFARLTGRRYYNKTLLLKNGMLTEYLDKMDMKEEADHIIEFAELLKDSDIDFLYVQVPSKVDMSGNLLPEGFKTYQNNNADELLNYLDQEKVHYIDLRQDMTSTSDDLERTFYRTDHHWNPIGAFYAFQRIANEMNYGLPSSSEVDYITDLNNWEIHRLKKWFLGYHGKRVGTFFGGTDDLIWLTPNFKTHISCSIPSHWEPYGGTFEEANIREKYVEEKSLFGYNPYCIYIGGDYSIVKHRNHDAPIHKRVVMLKDSFTLPVQAYMSTMFTEVDVIDPRYYNDYGVAEYIEASKPDYVIMMFRVTDNTKIHTGYLTAEARETFVDNIIAYNTITEKNNLNISTVHEDGVYETLLKGDVLEKGKWYSVELSGLDTNNLRSFCSIALYNEETKTSILRDIIDIDYYKDNRYVFKFKVPDVENISCLELRLFPGMPDDSVGKELHVEKIKICLMD